MVWNVPDSLSALVIRCGFTATKKNRRHWYRVFEPTDKNREKARAVLGHLKAAGLTYGWKEVEHSERKPIKAFKRQEYKPIHHHRAINFATPNVSHGWRLKRRRK
jgi:hypothetical protein